VLEQVRYVDARGSWHERRLPWARS
jgi:hypothetical protein